jgi:hypothetical protein
VIALHNAAAELEHSNGLDEAVEQYTRPWLQLGSKHPITQTGLAKFSQAKVRHKSTEVQTRPTNDWRAE